MARRSRVLQVARGVKRRLQRVVSKTRDAGERVRATILLLYAEGRSSAEIAAAVRYDVSAVRKVRQRFEAKLRSATAAAPRVPGSSTKTRSKPCARSWWRRPRRSGRRARPGPGSCL